MRTFRSRRLSTALICLWMAGQPALAAQDLPGPLQEVRFDQRFIIGQKTEEFKIVQVGLQKFFVFGPADFIADNCNVVQSDFSGQLADMFGGVDTALPRFHHHDQFVHRFCRCPTKVLDAGLHVHDHHFIASQHNVHDQRPE